MYRCRAEVTTPLAWPLRLLLVAIAADATVVNLRPRLAHLWHHSQEHARIAALDQARSHPKAAKAAPAVTDAPTAASSPDAAVAAAAAAAAAAEEEDAAVAGSDDEQEESAVPAAAPPVATTPSAAEPVAAGSTSSATAAAMRPAAPDAAKPPEELSGDDDGEATKVTGAALQQLREEREEVKQNRINVGQLQDALQAEVALLRESTAMQRVARSPRGRKAAEVQVRRSERLVKETSGMLQGSRAAAVEDAQHALKLAGRIRDEASNLVADATKELQDLGPVSLAAVATRNSTTMIA